MEQSLYNVRRYAFSTQGGVVPLMCDVLMRDVGSNDGSKRRERIIWPGNSFKYCHRLSRGKTSRPLSGSRLAPDQECLVMPLI
jgi:hypothetical protein